MFSAEIWEISEFSSEKIPYLVVKIFGVAIARRLSIANTRRIWFCFCQTSVNSKISANLLLRRLSIAKLRLISYWQTSFLNYPVQSQIERYDWELFAIAFAVSICFGMNPSKVNFDQEKIRKYLENKNKNKQKKKKTCNFPFNINSNWKKKKKK